jgi:hypothetical protein
VSSIGGHFGQQRAGSAGGILHAPARPALRGQPRNATAALSQRLKVVGDNRRVITLSSSNHKDPDPP